MVFRLEDKWQNYRAIKRSASINDPVQGMQTPDEDVSMYPSLQSSPQEATLPLPRILRWLGLSALGIVIAFFVVSPVVVNALENAKDSEMAIAAISNKKDKAIVRNDDSLLEAMGQNLGKMAIAFVPRAHASENASKSGEALMMLGMADNMLSELPAGDVGKPDPFAPSLGADLEIDPLTGEAKEKEIDVLDLIRFTGLIDDDNAGERIVVLEINDPDLGVYTEVKKMGKSFSLMGKTILLSSVSGQNLSLKVDGARRSMLLTPYTDISVAPSVGSGVATPDAPVMTSPGQAGVPLSDTVRGTLNGLEEM